MTCNELQSKLAPYVDSELPSAELTEFEAHLRGCASCAAQALGLLQMKRGIHAAGLRYTPTPEFRLRLQESIRAKSHFLKPRFSWFTLRIPALATAAVAAMLLIASVVLWQGRAANQRTVAELVDTHVATLASANPVDVISTDRHTVKPWFAGKLPFTFNLPELQNTEFTLDGGRLAYFGHSPGAQLIFNVRKHRLSVFIFQEKPGVLPFRAASSTSTTLAFHTETWSAGGLRYYIVSDAPASDVNALAELLKNAR
jgi:anti-sigma factor RsiW